MWDACGLQSTPFSSLTLTCLTSTTATTGGQFWGPRCVGNRSAGPGLPRLAIHKPIFVDSASIVAANVHIPSGRLLASYQNLTFHMVR